MVRRHAPSDARSIGELVGGRFLMQQYVLEDEPFRPEVVAWMVDGFVLKPFLRAPGREGSLRESLEQALGGVEDITIGAVRVADDDLAEAARALLPDVPVRVAPTPEIDDLQQSMNEHFAESGAHTAPTYLEGGADPALVAAFFEAAAEMWRAKPWKAILAEEQVLCVHAPELGLDEAVVLVVGALGENFGLTVFHDAAQYIDAMDGYEPTPERPHFGVPVCMLSFDNKTALPGAMQREIKRHRWTVAGRGATPVATVLDPDGACPPIRSEDYRALTACAVAVTRFIEAHPDLFDTMEPQPVTETFTVEMLPGAPQIRVTAPHPGAPWVLSDEAWDDEPVRTRGLIDDHPLGPVLRALGAPVEGWGADALIFGALASAGTHNPIAGLLGVLFQDVGRAPTREELDRVLSHWNELSEAQRRGEFHLSVMPLSDPPTAGELLDLAERRRDEVAWFFEGFDPPDAPPAKLVPEAEAIVAQLEGSMALFGSCVGDEMTARDRRNLAAQLTLVTGATERLLQELAEVTAAARLAEFERRRTPARRGPKPGRNAPCLCGSERKYKKCCGAPARSS